MKEYIDKAAVKAEIERRKIPFKKDIDDGVYPTYLCALMDFEDFLDTLEVKGVEEYKQPEYSCFETTYKCGKKPHWNVGDILAYYEFCSDREGEHILGKVTNVEFNEAECDWFYTLEDGRLYEEELLLEDETYKKK